MGLFNFFRRLKKREVSSSDKYLCGAGMIGENELAGEGILIDGLDYLKKEDVDLGKMFYQISFGELSCKLEDPRRVKLTKEIEVSSDRLLVFEYEFFIKSLEKDVLITCYKTLYKVDGDSKVVIDGFSRTISPLGLKDMGYQVSTAALIDNFVFKSKLGETRLDIYSSLSRDAINKVIFNGK